MIGTDKPGDSVAFWACKLTWNTSDTLLNTWNWDRQTWSDEASLVLKNRWPAYPTSNSRHYPQCWTKVPASTSAEALACRILRACLICCIYATFFWKKNSYEIFSSWISPLFVFCELWSSHASSPNAIHTFCLHLRLCLEAWSPRRL